MPRSVKAHSSLLDHVTEKFVEVRENERFERRVPKFAVKRFKCCFNFQWSFHFYCLNSSADFFLLSVQGVLSTFTFLRTKLGNYWLIYKLYKKVKLLNISKLKLCCEQ